VRLPSAFRGCLRKRDEAPVVIDKAAVTERDPLATVRGARFAAAILFIKHDPMIMSLNYQ
jgi:hypothetical protein